MWWWIGAVASAGELQLGLTAVDFDLSADTERSVERILTRVHAAYQSWLGVVFPPILPVKVDLIASAETYRQREVAAMGNHHGNTVGFFQSAKNLEVVWRGQGEGEMRHTLVHETSHFLLVAGGLGGVPLYLHEGLAELFETASLDGNAVWLVPDPKTVGWLNGRALPSASTMIGWSPADWDAAANTPWGRAEYPYGWALCGFLLSTEPGRHALSDLLASTAASHDPGRDGTSAVERSYPGGSAALDRAFRAWVQAPTKLQLPVHASGADAAGAGWKRCADGSLVRADAGYSCGRWVKGADGMQHYVKE